MTISFLGVVGSGDGAGSSGAIALTDDVPAGSLLLLGLTWSGYGSNADATNVFNLTGPNGEDMTGLYTTGGGTGVKVTGSSRLGAGILLVDASIGEEVTWVFRQPTSPFALRSADWAAVLLGFDGNFGNTVFADPDSVFEHTGGFINDGPDLVGEETHSGRDIDMVLAPGTAKAHALLVAALTHIGAPSDVGSLPAGWVLPVGGQASRAGVANTATVEGGTRTVDMAYRIVNAAGDYPIDVALFYAGASRYHTHQVDSFIEVVFPPPADIIGIPASETDAAGTPGHIIVGPGGASL